MLEGTPKNLRRRTSTNLMVEMDFFSQLNSPISLVAAFATVLLVCHLSAKLIRNGKSKSLPPPPQAGGALPIIGHLHLLGGPQLPHITLGAMADKYGPIFTLRLGVHQAVVVSNPGVAKELFTTNDMVVSSRPKFIAGKYFGYNYAMFGFSPYGSYWRELRKITSLELLSSRRLELLKHVSVSETTICIKELYKVWTEKRNDSGLVMVEMKQWFADLTLNVIIRMVVGKRYFGVNMDPREEKEARECQRIMRDLFYFLGLFLVSDSIPYLRFLDLGGHEKAMKKSSKEMDILMEKWMKEHRQNRNSGKVVINSEQDFMDVLMTVVEDADLHGCFDDDTIVKSTCVSIIAGGSDTPTVMLVWAVSLLLNNPSALKRAQQELEIQVGRERQVEESDINKLVYLQAVIKETLRLYPAGPLGIREFTEDCTVSGYHIPKGTRLLVNVWKLQRDPQVWSDPLEFKPERFLAAHKDVDVKGQHFELIPFGAGRRFCPATAFSIQMLHLVLATLLHSFEISTLSDAPVDMTESVGLNNIKATPLDVVLAPRLPSHLY